MTQIQPTPKKQIRHKKRVEVLAKHYVWLQAQATLHNVKRPDVITAMCDFIDRYCEQDFFDFMQQQYPNDNLLAAIKIPIRLDKPRRKELERLDTRLKPYKDKPIRDIPDELF